MELREATVEQDLGDIDELKCDILSKLARKSFITAS